jgi:hypothetical protein
MHAIAIPHLRAAIPARQIEAARKFAGLRSFNLIYAHLFRRQLRG